MIRMGLSLGLLALVLLVPAQPVAAGKDEASVAKDPLAEPAAPPVREIRTVMAPPLTAEERRAAPDEFCVKYTGSRIVRTEPKRKPCPGVNGGVISRTRLDSDGSGNLGNKLRK